MFAQVQGFIEEGQLQIQEDGSARVVDDPVERAEIISQSKKKRKTGVADMDVIQPRGGSFQMEGQDPNLYGSEQQQE